MTPIFHLKSCSSTNDEIDTYLLYENMEGAAICTFNQTSGKGQYGNSWQTKEDLNIAYSLAIPAEKIVVRQDLFNFRTATVLRAFLANMTREHVEVKWPNDLIIQQKKIAGILVERKTVGGRSYLVVGIGLNVLQENFQNLPKAGSLLTQTGMRFDLTEFSEHLHRYMSDHLTIAIADTEIVEEINQWLFRKDIISVFEIAGIRQNGIITKVDEDGFLWVQLEKDGVKKFFHKEIELLY